MSLPLLFIEVFVRFAKDERREHLAEDNVDEELSTAGAELQVQDTNSLTSPFDTRSKMLPDAQDGKRYARDANALALLIDTVTIRLQQFYF